MPWSRRRLQVTGDIAMRNMEELFVHLLKDIYYAEKQLVKALPKMAKAAETPKLKQAFENHLAETEGQVERLEKVFDIVGKAARGEKCEAIVGLIAEGKEVIEDGENAAVIDAGILAAAQAVEHYEMARYGTLVAWARQLGHKDAASLLESNLKEEKAADQLLTRIAESQVNAAS
jgi:ferritin-like metal-binding protein YciE